MKGGIEVTTNVLVQEANTASANEANTEMIGRRIRNGKRRGVGGIMRADIIIITNKPLTRLNL
jgi:hypothetical protein